MDAATEILRSAEYYLKKNWIDQVEFDSIWEYMKQYRELSLTISEMLMELEAETGVQYYLDIEQRINKKRIARERLGMTAVSILNNADKRTAQRVLGK